MAEPVIVHTFGPAWDSIDMSPFSVKLQTWLRMVGQPFEIRISNSRAMPKGKLPVLGQNGKLIPDSEFIINMLREQLGDPLHDEELDTVTKVQAYTVRAMIESELYFTGVYFRWADDDGFKHVRPRIMEFIQTQGAPKWLSPWIASPARKMIKNQTYQQGIGRHKPHEIEDIRTRGFHAISDLLGNNIYFYGDQPHSIDATLFAFIHVTITTPFRSPALKAAIRPNLLAYHRRMVERYWPERAGRVSAPVTQPRAETYHTELRGSQPT